MIFARIWMQYALVSSLLIAQPTPTSLTSVLRSSLYSAISFYSATNSPKELEKSPYAHRVARTLAATALA